MGTSVNTLKIRICTALIAMPLSSTCLPVRRTQTGNCGHASAGHYPISLRCCAGTSSPIVTCGIWVDNPFDTPPQQSFLKASHAILVGYAATNVISRAGEIARGVALQEDRRLPLSGVLATILVGRAIDMPALLIFLSGVLYFSRDRIAAARPSTRCATYRCRTPLPSRR